MASPSRELEDYWNEAKTIEQQDTHSDDDELSKTPDEGEFEARWLQWAGYGSIVNKFQDGKELSDGELETLTHSLTGAQAEAVRKRINVLSTTLRRKGRVSKVHVKDIFPPQDDASVQFGGLDASTLPRASTSLPPRSSTVTTRPSRPIDQRSPAFSHKGAYSMSGSSNEVTQDNNAGIATLGVHPRNTSDTSSSSELPSVPELPSVSDIEIALDFHLEEADKQTRASSIPDPHRLDLPAFEPKADPLGVTLIGDLTEVDMDRIKALALIELTALFDVYNISYPRTKRKKKVKEQGIFGVPLDMLVEQDQKRSPGTKVPIVFQAMISFLEREGLNTEGILRVSGAETRTKQLRQELEDKFYQGLFSWGDASPHDVAVVLKQFLRELPVPLLSYDSLDAFPQVSSIATILEQLKALNLLILLLTEEHRDTLKVLLRFLRSVISHSNHNKMGLYNVAMIMAPNLFLVPARSNKEKADLDMELKRASGTCNIVKMLVHYQDVLWTIPSAFIAQVRHQYTTEAHRKTKERILSKLPWKKDKDKSEIYKKPPPNPDQPENQDGVIRVQAPHLSKSSTLIQLDQFTTAADVVAKFKRGTGINKDSTFGQTQETNGHSFRNPNKTQYAHDSNYLFEVGGNIAERCLDPRTKMTDLYHVNPLAEWVIKTREGRQLINLPTGH